MSKRTYWVMYGESTRDGKPFHKGTDKVAQVCQHVGYSCDDDNPDAALKSAQRDVLHFRDLASQGKHFLNERQWPNLVINSAWIEVESRQPVEF